MKKIGLFIWSLITIALLGTSCNVLDLDPTDRTSPATVWGSESSLDQYVTGFYAAFRDRVEIKDSQESFTDAYSDIIKSSSWDSYSHSFNKTSLQPTAFTNSGAGVFERWGIHYERIRRHNEFLRDIPIYGGKFSNEFLDIRKAEVLFCRAYTYMDLIRIYGGVVLRTQVDGPNENNKPRATEAESWDLVLEDLQFAADHLPGDKENPWSADNTGRATKAAAYGLMSRAALYAKRWDLAVTAANKANEFGGKLLTGDNAYQRVFDNSSLNSSEMLFAVAFDGKNLPHRHDNFFRPKYDQTTHNGAPVYAAFGPTSELADTYEMADGTPFSWKSHGADPYANREPRFYASILYNGASWEERTIETFVDGKDGFKAFEKASTAGTTVTGYYFRKFLTEGGTDWEKAASGHFFPICRYAEVLLNKAEALAEADFGKNKVEALAALNEVRGRVNLPARDAADKKAFMDLVRKERMVELAGEGFRYWDLRRWHLSVKVLDDKAMHGVKITKQADGTFTYEQVEVDAGDKRIFYEKFYAFSLPLTERSNNPALGDNNPGW